MPKKSAVTKAIEGGNWAEAEKQAKAALRKSGAEILARRAPRDRPETIRRFEGLEPDAQEPADTSEDAVQEYVEDAPDDGVDVLPEDDQEARLTPAELKPVVTLAKAYADYHEKGGNRVLEQRAIDYLGPADIERIDRAFVIEAARRLYPTLSKTERAARLYEPLDEILGGLAPPAPQTDGWWTERKWQRDLAYERELRIFCDRLEKIEELCRALTLGDEKRSNEIRAELGWSPLEFQSAEDFWRTINSFTWEPRRNDWADVSKPYRPSGPPPDPPPRLDTGSFYVWGTPQEQWRYRHRGALSKLRMPDGTEISFGYPPSTRNESVLAQIDWPDGTPVWPEEFVYLGYLPGKAGRPRKPNKLTNAEKQRHYRQRRKQRKE